MTIAVLWQSEGDHGRTPSLSPTPLHAAPAVTVASKAQPAQTTRFRGGTLTVDNHLFQARCRL